MKTSLYSNRYSTLLVFLFSHFLIHGNIVAKDVSTVPVNIQAALTLKLLAFHKGLASSKEVSIYVINAPEYAGILAKARGKPIGTSKLTDVIEGNELPKEIPSVIYLNDETKLDEVLTYSRANSVLTITGDPALFAKGVTLGFSVSGRKPKILINLSSSKLESVNWNPAILKIAITSK